MPTPISDSLINPSFEESSGGVPVGWRKFGGEMHQVSQPKAHGDFALAFNSTTTAVKWVFQPVTVEPGQYYMLTALALKNGSAVQDVSLRVSWYESYDGSGQLISSDDSPSLNQDSTDFVLLTTGPIQAPPDAHSASIRLMLRPASAAPATAYFDDVRWQETEPPQPRRLYAGWNVIELREAPCQQPRDAFADLITSETMKTAWLFVGETQLWLGYDPLVADALNNLKQVFCGDILWLYLTTYNEW